MIHRNHFFGFGRNRNRNPKVSPKPKPEPKPWQKPIFWQIFISDVVLSSWTLNNNRWPMTFRWFSVIFEWNCIQSRKKDFWSFQKREKFTKIWVSVRVSVDRNSNLVSVTKRKLTFSFIKPLWNDFVISIYYVCIL